MPRTYLKSSSTRGEAKGGTGWAGGKENDPGKGWRGRKGKEQMPAGKKRPPARRGPTLDSSSD